MKSKLVSKWLNEYYKTSTLQLKPLYNNNDEFEKPYENKSSISLNTIEVVKILLSLKSNTN